MTDVVIVRILAHHLKLVPVVPYPTGVKYRRNWVAVKLHPKTDFCYACRHQHSIACTIQGMPWKMT
eukprot:1150252-Pelagomonas_calceolata.AAC.2